MEATLTKEKCKRILFNLGIKHGISPALISQRLLDESDKEDMMNGLVPVDVLDLAVKVWKEYGMCDWAEGSGETYSKR